MNITGLVLTFNGERLLGRCLDSLSFCDRVLVVDSDSTDRTRDIAEAAGAEVLVRAWEGPGPQFAYALERIPDGLVVSLDQDEYLEPGLIEDIRRVARGRDGTEGWWVNRRSFYYDRFLKHGGWYPDWLLRVFLAGRMRVEVSGAHYSFHPLGPTARLTGGEIVHHPYRDLREHLDKINYYAQQAALEKRAQGKPGGLARGLAHGAARFFKLYLLKAGFLDGGAGLLNALHGAVYALHKYIRVTERPPNDV